MLKKSIDVFPALIKLAPPGSLSDYTTLQTTGDVPQGTRRVDRSRAVVINNVLIIAQDSPEGPAVVFKEAIEGMTQEGKTSHVLTVSGKIIAISKDDNCGCGSRLRGWNPMGSAILTSSEDPNA
jgi:hypothetical protein